jgi:hypothetical protein
MVAPALLFPLVGAALAVVVAWLDARRKSAKPDLYYQVRQAPGT